MCTHIINSKTAIQSKVIRAKVILMTVTITMTVTVMVTMTMTMMTFLPCQPISLLLLLRSNPSPSPRKCPPCHQLIITLAIIILMKTSLKK